MKKIRVEDAVGTVLAHDMTKIVPGEFKGVAFKKGHVVKESDIQELLQMGKQSVFVLELSENELHENDAAKRIATAISDHTVSLSEPSEGKISLIAKAAGLLKIDEDRLLDVNRMEKIIVATLKNNFPCQMGQTVAGTRIIPLTIEGHHIEHLETLINGAKPVISIKPYQPLKVGAVVTGSEVYEGLIKDEFDRTIGAKLTDHGCTIVKKITVPDEVEMIANAIHDLQKLDCDVIVTTGGLSVDPDDVTLQGVAKTGASRVFYGSPVLPGAMLMISMLGQTPVVSLPACVFYYEHTVFDLILPRILAGETIAADEVAAMGHGGLCMNCEVCHYPVCSFGR